MAMRTARPRSSCPSDTPSRSTSRIGIRSTYRSVGVLAKAASYPAVFEDATPVFDGTITSSATSMAEATAPGGGTESITFVASAAGEYALVCPVGWDEEKE